jgi:hypothetical protein
MEFFACLFKSFSSVTQLDAPALENINFSPLESNPTYCFLAVSAPSIPTIRTPASLTPVPATMIP